VTAKVIKGGAELWQYQREKHLKQEETRDVITYGRSPLPHWLNVPVAASISVLIAFVQLAATTVTVR
jgi:hypothetical protein